MTAATATGNVKTYQTVIGGILLAILPVAYIVLKLGGNPTSVYIVHLAICTIAFVARLLIVRPLISLSLSDYFKYVLSPCISVAALSYFIALIIKYLLPSGLLFSGLCCLTCILIVVLLSLLLGCTKGERVFIQTKANAILSRFK
jgi:hypothetical protein